MTNNLYVYIPVDANEERGKKKAKAAGARRWGMMDNVQKITMKREHWMMLPS